ncbi:MAG: SAM-dependent methyltransferase [Elusimicrobia bacterium CG11_big_fil_rev_8_21_14_0_20_64_6]|nr:MAG: SAM-dependent methyltransferase [Elusimicrobia bacterium CG11_big_fil_rev_8_21_14_0_20_64_6]
MTLHAPSENEVDLSVALRRLIVGKVVGDLRGGRTVSDLQFDQVYPPEIRRLSPTHWTPVEVAVRAGALLAPDESARVLDVGSGCGKFCSVAALSGLGRFIGVEQRPHLLAAAEMSAEELGADRASFVPGNMADLDWSSFDAFYLFNPFFENSSKSIRIDETVSFGGGKFARYVEVVRAKLDNAKAGTKVATYHGFGGEMPAGYRRVKKEPMRSDFLELWVKRN